MAVTNMGSDGFDGVPDFVHHNDEIEGKTVAETGCSRVGERAPLVDCPKAPFMLYLGLPK